MPEIALFQPDIAGNVGTILRSAACFNAACSIIEPCGFAFSERAIKRAGMDYTAMAQMHRHADWFAFDAWRKARGKRLVLFSSKADTLLPTAHFTPDDILLMGSESAGAPDYVHEAADALVRIPMAANCRSLNIAVATGIALAEALRQTHSFPE